MRVKLVEMEILQDYKKTAMLIGCISCDWKCLKEQNLPLDICQNCKVAGFDTIDIPNARLINLYKANTITSSIIFAGLEPLLQQEEVLDFISEFRKTCDDDIVIYTGYYPEEIKDFIDKVSVHKNIIMKFGRFIPNKKPRYDEILGVVLASDNQFAQIIS